MKRIAFSLVAGLALALGAGCGTDTSTKYDLTLNVTKLPAVHAGQGVVSCLYDSKGALVVGSCKKATVTTGGAGGLDSFKIEWPKALSGAAAEYSVYYFISLAETTGAVCKPTVDTTNTVHAYWWKFTSKANAATVLDLDHDTPAFSNNAEGGGACAKYDDAKNAK